MKRFLLLPLLLCGCATAVDQPSQEIYFDLVNENNVSARCLFETPHQRVQFYAPGYAKVQRSRYDAEVFCQTSNGNSAKQNVETSVNEKSKWNVLNAGVGFFGDVLEETAWAYPSKVTINFESVSAIVNDVPPPLSYAETAQQDNFGFYRDVARQTRMNLDGQKKTAPFASEKYGAGTAATSGGSYVDPFAR